MTGINLLLLILAIPLLALLFLMGPVAFIGGLIGIGILLLYLLQSVLGFDLVAHPPPARDARWAFFFSAGLGPWAFFYSVRSLRVATISWIALQIDLYEPYTVRLTEK